MISKTFQTKPEIRFERLSPTVTMGGEYGGALHITLLNNTSILGPYRLKLQAALLFFYNFALNFGCASALAMTRSSLRRILPAADLGTTSRNRIPPLNLL